MNNLKKQKGGNVPSPRGARYRRDGVQVVCLTAYVPPDLAVRARVHAARGGESMSSLVAAALSDHLGGA